MSAFLDALGWLGSSLDKPGAAVRGLLAGRPDQLANLIPFSDTMGLTDPSQRTEGADLLGLERDSTGGMLGGMAVNMATDPLNWLLGAGLARNLVRGRQMEGAYQTAQTGYQGELAARQALLPAMEKAQANNALRQELLASGGMPEEVAQLTKAVDESGQPVRTYHGTNAAYEKFDPAMDRGANLYGPGYYSTVDQGVAGGYSSQVPDLRLEYANDPDLFMDQVRARVAGLNPAERTGHLRRMEAIRRTATDPPDELAQLHAHFATAGPAFGDLYNPSSPNVRMQHLDLRNPLDIDKVYPHAEAESLLRQMLGPPEIHGVPQYIWERPPVTGQKLYRLLEEYSSRGPVPENLSQPERLERGGFDSIMHTGGLNRGQPHQVYIAHRPEQIYSPWVAPLQMAEPALPGAYPPARPVAPRVSPMVAALLAQNSLGRTG